MASAQMAASSRRHSFNMQIASDEASKTASAVAEEPMIA
jgi:hypothetical protein